MEFLFLNNNTELISCNDPTEIVSVPFGVTKIMPNAFKNDLVKKIILPTSVKSLARGSFTECQHLEFVEMPSNPKCFGCSFCKCQNLKGIISKDNSLIKVFKDLSGNFIVPPNITYISEGCFCGCDNISSIVFPSGLKAIGRLAFNKCSKLETITIPETVKYIGESAFKECYNLKKVLIPRSLTKLSPNLFEDCTNLEEINIYDKKNSIPISELIDLQDTCKDKLVFIGNPFTHCNKIEIIHNKQLYSPLIKNRSYSIPEGIIKICSHAFENRKALKRVYLPNGLESIESYAFKDCYNLTDITIPSSVKYIKDFAFSGCSSIRKICFKDNSKLSEIGMYAFCGCTSLKSIIIPQGLTEIKIKTFKDCTNLKDITLPPSIQRIHTSAFNGCNNIENVNMSKKWDKHREKLGLPSINRTNTSYRSLNDNYELGIFPDGPMLCTQGSINPCPYCGHYGTSPYTDGNAQCNDCKRWFKYTQHWF